jgi:hypothetical protein
MKMRLILLATALFAFLAAIEGCTKLIANALGS